MTLILTFFLVFAVGPATFWMLAKQRPTKRYFVLLWVISIALVVLAIVVVRLSDTVLQPSPFLGLTAILALWFSWITVLALCVLAICQRTRSEGVTRWVFAIGAMATTLPWFGYYVAHMVAG